jgi:hypothetical protein
MQAFSRYLPAVFFVLLGLWTVALLVPIPKGPAEVVGDDLNKLFFAKALHASAYAFLTILAGLINATRRQHWWLLALLSFHGFATEFLQLFVDRGASWNDVRIDHIGIFTGLLIGWRQWRILLPPRPEAK